MEQNVVSQNIDEIDLENIDWNTLTPEQWSSLEHSMQAKHRAFKLANRPPTMINKKQI